MVGREDIVASVRSGMEIGVPSNNGLRHVILGCGTKEETLLRQFIQTAIKTRQRSQRQRQGRSSSRRSPTNPLRFESLEPRLLLDSYTALQRPTELQYWNTTSADNGYELPTIGGTARNPAVPTNLDAVWVTSQATGESVASVNLTYLVDSGSTSANTVFTETFGMGTVGVKPWTGTTGSTNLWTVAGSSYLSLDPSANYITSTADYGLFYKGKTAATNGLTDVMRVKEQFPAAFRMLQGLDPQNLGGQVPTLELYDLQTDPDELRNLAGSAAARSERDRLYAALRQWVRDTADPAVDPQPLFVE